MESAFKDRTVWRIAIIGVAAVSLVALGGGVWYAANSSARAKKKANNDGGTSSSSSSSSTGKAEHASSADKNSLEKEANKTDTAQKVEGTESFVEEYRALTTEERKKLAQEAKDAGNKAFGAKNFTEAIDLYTKAISLSPAAIYYNNRAACHANLKNYDQAIEDCNRALELEPLYAKALNRRGMAYEKQSSFINSLRDFTLVCVLEEFKVQSTLSSTDRVLKSIGTELAAEVVKSRSASLPSPAFVTAFMDSFNETGDGIEAVLEMPVSLTGDELLIKAHLAVKERRYEEALGKVEEAVATKAFSTPKFECMAYNLRGTFYFLMGKVLDAADDLDKAHLLCPDDCNTSIKQASLLMERGLLEDTMKLLANAEKASPKNSDLFYHRGQVQFLTGNVDAAVEDYRKSIALNPNFIYARIQLGVSLYKKGLLSEAEDAFAEATKKFEQHPQIYNYHGEIKMDQGKDEEAMKLFDKSIQLDATSPLPFINKSILYLQLRQDPVSAERECRAALQVDPRCDLAYTQLAQLLLHQSKIKDAVEIYEKSLDVMRTEAELANVIACREAAKAQLWVLETHPSIAKKFGQ